MAVESGRSTISYLFLQIQILLPSPSKPAILKLDNKLILHEALSQNQFKLKLSTKLDNSCVQKSSPQMAMNSFLVRCSYIISHPSSSKNAVSCVLSHFQSSSLIKSTIVLMWKDKTAIQYSLLVSLLFPKLSVTFLKSTSLQIL